MLGLGLSQNLNSESLTPPVSPADFDLESMDAEESVNRSPVLLGKRSIQRRPVSNDEQTKGYPDPVVCRHAIVEPCDDRFACGNGYVHRAHEFWNFDMLPLSEHTCRPSEKFRTIMEAERSLDLCEDPEECADMFYEGLTYVQDLEECARKWTQSFNANISHYTEVAKKYRRFVWEMLTFVSEYITHSCWSTEEHDESLINILNLLVMMSNQMHVFMGDGLQAMIKEDVETVGDRVPSSPIRECFHAYTDTQFTLLKALPLLTQNLAVSRHAECIQLHYENGCNITEASFVWKFIKGIFAQGTKIAAEKFLQLSRQSKIDKGHFMQDTLFSKSPFPCQCMQQLLVLCIKVAVKTERDNAANEQAMDSCGNTICSSQQDKSLDSTGATIWKILTSFMNTIIQNAQNKAKNLKNDLQPLGCPSFPAFSDVQDALSFCWWWTWHVSNLFLFEADGNEKVNTQTVPPCMPLMSRFIRLTLATCEDPPKLLAAHLVCYQALSSLWRCERGVGTSITAGELAHFQVLWSHFSKHMNSAPKDGRPGMHKFAIREDKTMTPSGWVRKCENLLKSKKPALTNEKSMIYDDGFTVFLSIFGEMLQCGAWNSIKDRFYSRLVSKEVKNLSEVGMSRLFHLFITISLACEDKTSREAVFTKLLEYANQVFLSKSDYRKQKALITGLFSCMIVSSQHSLDMSAIATKCGRTFSFLCKFFLENERNPDQRSSLWKVISLYLQNLSELCQITSSFTLGQCHLMPTENLPAALSKLRPSESPVVFESLTTILSSLSSHIEHSTSKESKSGAALLCLNISKQFLPWLKAQSTSEQSNAEAIVGAALEFVLTHLQIFNAMLDKSSAQAILNLIEHFGCCVEVTLRTRFLFMVGLLTHDHGIPLTFLNQQNKTGEAARLLAIQGCLKCIVIHSNDGDRVHLMSCLFQIGDIAQVFQVAGKNTTDPTFEDFLSALEERYNSSKSFMERKERKDQATSWFSPIHDVLFNFSKSVANAEIGTLLTVYRTCGDIVLHCSKILYTTGKRGLVAQIFDTLVLPRWVYAEPGKSPHSNLLLALGQTLHKYLQCLLNLDYKRDSYLQRILSDIVNLYLTRFPAGTNSASHPFRKVLSHLMNTDQRCALLKLMKDSCQSGPNLNTKLSMVVEILHSWAVGTGTKVTSQEAGQLLPLLEQARVALRSLPAMVTKINELVKLLRLSVD